MTKIAVPYVPLTLVLDCIYGGSLLDCVVVFIFDIVSIWLNTKPCSWVYALPGNQEMLSCSFPNAVHQDNMSV